MAFKKNPAKKKTLRAKGEGSIFQRADGMWVGSVELPPDDEGKRQQKRVYSKDQRTLVAKLDELKTDVGDGLTAINRSMTLAQWMDYWLPHIHRKRIRPTTYKDYTFTARNIVTTIGHKRVVELTPADVRRMHELLGVGKRRTAKAHTMLGRALRDAIAEGVVKRNVALVVDPPDVKPPHRATVHVADAQKILAYAAAHRNVMESARWLTAFLTGIRQGEALGLTWDRVNLDDGAIDVTWQLQQLKRQHGCGKKDGDTWPCGKNNVGYCTNPVWDMPTRFEYTPLHAGLCLTRPKSEAGKRWVPVIEPLRLALKNLAEVDAGTNPHNLVFHRADGRPVTPSDDHAAWTKLLRDAQVLGAKENLTLHAARRTAATVLRAAGADEHTRMEILGHNSPEVTRIYAQVDQAKNSTMMTALSALLPPDE